MGLADVLADLESAGYTVLDPLVIPASAVGAPHRRYRVFPIAIDNGRRPESPSLAELVEHGARTQWHSELHEAYRRSVMEDTTGAQREAGTEVEGILRALYQNGAERGNIDRSGSAQPGIMVAYTGCTRWEEQHLTTEPIDEGHSAWSDVADWRVGATQPGMGRDVNGLSSWLDGYRRLVESHLWPAGLGQEQHCWEPARVAIRPPHRVPRLKALGNAVVPWQALPLLLTIRFLIGEKSRNGLPC